MAAIATIKSPASATRGNPSIRRNAIRWCPFLDSRVNRVLGQVLCQKIGSGAGPFELAGANVGTLGSCRLDLLQAIRCTLMKERGCGDANPSTSFRPRYTPPAPAKKNLK